MKKPHPILPVVTPHMSVLDLVNLAKAGEPQRDWKFFIETKGVELNGSRLTRPEQMLNLQTGDVLRIDAQDWYEIKIVDVNELETQRLRLKLMELKDVDQVEEMLPDWAIVQYLAATMHHLEQQNLSARDIFRLIIEQAEPKSEWLWKIAEKLAPEKIIGLAHLRSEDGQGNENIWIDPAYRGQGYATEALEAMNEHAFERLGLDEIEFKEAFSHAAGAPEMDDLRKAFNSADEGSELHPEGSPDKPWSLNKKNWQDARDKIRKAFAETAEDDGSPAELPASVEEESPPPKKKPVAPPPENVPPAALQPQMLPDGTMLMPDGTIFNPLPSNPSVAAAGQVGAVAGQPLPNVSLPPVMPVLPNQTQVAGMTIAPMTPLPSGAMAVAQMFGGAAWRPGMPITPGMAWRPGMPIAGVAWRPGMPVLAGMVWRPGMPMMPGMVMPAQAPLASATLPPLGQPQKKQPEPLSPQAQKPAQPHGPPNPNAPKKQL